MRLTGKPDIGTIPRDVSSRKRQASTIEPPEPPYSSAIEAPSHPRPASFE
jgi:hypothetical protein